METQHLAISSVGLFTERWLLERSGVFRIVSMVEVGRGRLNLNAGKKGSSG